MKIFDRFRKKAVVASLACERPVPVFERVEVVVEDVVLVMRFEDGTRRKEFKAHASYCPLIATQARGIYTSDTTDIAKNFISWFAKDCVAVIGDEVLRFDRFMSATLERTKRTISVRVPVA